MSLEVGSDKEGGDGLARCVHFWGRQNSRAIVKFG
jgi:hypothetical protein